MAIPFHIIDGYNLLHAAGLGRATYGRGDLERARNRLLAFLRTHLGPAERARTTVVFDAGDAPPDRPRQVAVEGMTILFASRGGDADAEIERLIAAHSAPRRIRVISGDHRLQKAARRRRAAAVDCEAFLAKLDRRGPVDEDLEATQQRRRDEPKYGGDVSSIETEHWLRVFGDALAAAETAEATAAGSEDPADSPSADSAEPLRGQRRSRSTAAGKPKKRSRSPRSRREAPTGVQSGTGESAPDTEAIGLAEIAFWQARVGELRRESVDPAAPGAENPG